MKHLKLNLALIFTTLILASSQLYSVHCCYHIVVSPSVNDDCCLEINITNPMPACRTNMAFLLEIFDGTNWVSAGIDTSANENMTMIYCPPSGTSSVTFRVLFADKYNLNDPHCNTTGFVEGITKHTETVDIDCCNGCPEGYQSWLNVTSTKSNDCPDNGCKVTHSFDMPDSISCYTSYKIDTDSNSTAILPILGDSLSGIDRCIEAGTTFNVSLTLYTDDGDSCIIDKSVECDEPRDTMDIQPPCMPDCYDDDFIMPPKFLSLYLTSCGPTCAVNVYYTHRKACGTYQDIQILRMEMSQGCSGCSDSFIYQQALLGIIHKNDMNFNPKDSGCATTWRVSQGGCWTDWTYYVVEQTTGIVDTIRVLEPCNETDCCLQPMTVCKFQNPTRITIAYDTTYTPSINCDSTWLEDPITGFILPCDPKCDWLSDFEGTYTPPNLASGKKAIEQEPLMNGSNIGMQIEDMSDKVIIQLRNSEMNSIKIRVYDILGKEIYNQESTLKEGSSFFTIRNDELQKGVHLVSIIVDGIKLRTQKVIIE